LLARRQLYTALSYWTGGGMLATTSAAGVQNTGDIGGSQDIALPAAPCGCVYYLNVDATFTATDMASMVCGTSQAADANGNTCSTAGIASPDNVAMIEDFDTLIIGEDTGNHRVDFMWQVSAWYGNAWPRRLQIRGRRSLHTPVAAVHSP
jgi:hypothetical protein